MRPYALFISLVGSGNWIWNCYSLEDIIVEYSRYWNILYAWQIKGDDKDNLMGLFNNLYALYLTHHKARGS